MLAVDLEIGEKVGGRVEIKKPEVEMKVKEDIYLVQLGPIVPALGIDLAREDLAGS